ncbi:MAG: carboxylesterase/lipase family protein [Promethearchaeota archaeon]
MGIIVNTSLGRIKGVQESNHQSFLGIRYAKPPVNELRFCAPLPIEAWDGIYDASRFGQNAPQYDGGLGIIKDNSEDCLYLNVYTPKADDGKRPVMVWIHGGGFVFGTGASKGYGKKIVPRGNIVLVTINYRLGVFGFFNWPGLTKNNGLLDQICALEWVRDNIRYFGGDHNNVTIFGQSSGGRAVVSLLAMPSAKGLFHKAIPQSGTAHPYAYDDTPSKKASKDLFDVLGINIGDIHSLREVDWTKLNKAQHEIFRKMNPKEHRILFPFKPIIDDETIPVLPLDAIRNGSAKDIPLLIGNTLDERKVNNRGLIRANQIKLIHKRHEKIDEASLLRFTYKYMKFYHKTENDAKTLIETYKKARKGKLPIEPYEIGYTINTDEAYRIPSIRTAEAQCQNQQNTYCYLFGFESPLYKDLLGACHTIDLPFIFGTYDHSNPNTEVMVGRDNIEELETFSNLIMDTWISFAKKGDPNHPGLPKWPKYELNNRATMILKPNPEIVNAPMDEERSAWESIL